MSVTLLGIWEIPENKTTHIPRVFITVHQGPDPMMAVKSRSGS